MIIGINVESSHQEQRVALVPAVVPALSKIGLQVLVEKNAGQRAGFADAEYEKQGAQIAAGREELLSRSEILVRLKGFGAAAVDASKTLHRGQFVIGLLDPFGSPESIRQIADTGATAFALELLPRISRAQSMDVLSSMATIAGYKAVLMAADQVKKMFPMMITAAGTITPARVFIIGAGVAGLQAIATSRRLGAVVKSYDVRPAVKEQVESLGAQFVTLDLEAQQAETAGGYAKELSEEFYRKQREKMAEVLAESDIVITTAAVQGKKAPILITKDMVHKMRPGAILVDLAAETGGNCELTKPGEKVEVNGVLIEGPVNLAATIPYHASQMYARNVTAFLQLLIKNGNVDLNLEDEIVRETLVSYNNEVYNPRLREILGLASIQAG